MVLDSYTCEFRSSGAEETMEHLFLQWPFATACWNLVHIQAPPQATIFDAVVSLKAQLRVPTFLDLIVLLFWAIRNSRNGVIFHAQLIPSSSCRCSFKKELSLLLHRVRPKYR